MSKRNSSQVVLQTCVEGGADLRDITWGVLITAVTKMADALRSSGVVKGDRVAGVLSNRLETVVACLATLSIGAIWSTSSPDMGADGVLDRVRQIRPKILFSETDILYNNKILDQRQKNRVYAKEMLAFSEFANLVVIERTKEVQEDRGLKLISLSDFLKCGTGRPLQFARLPFSHPGFIVYSSGTVSLPDPLAI
jgi:acetoacetyl-CoA synthetase